VPAYNTLTVKVWGAGAGGQGDDDTSDTLPLGTHGGTSSFNGTVIANGGKNDRSGGTASGGDINTSGSAGGAVGNGTGGASPNGGGTTSCCGVSGAAPGAGGSGAMGTITPLSPPTRLQGGGGGAYAQKNYSAGQLTTGASISVIVGTGGARGGVTALGGNGGAGRVVVTWN
jgi:hypothetical protein